MNPTGKTTARLVLGVVSGVFFVLLGVLGALGVWWATSNMENPGPLALFPVLFVLIALAGVGIIVVSIVQMRKFSAAQREAVIN